MTAPARIAGYRIDRQIGRGGMAMVYLAIQESLDRPVALKVLNPLYSDTPEFSERFLKEGRIVASLQHTSIITIHDIGISEGFHYISMEYVDGGDLRARMTEGITPEAALSYTERIGEALRGAHEVNVVHRDVKPSNILFRKDGVLLLTDFGIAKQLDDTTDLTIAGTMLGSPAYLSPEQARAQPVDGRADIYSLGIMLYEMLVGKKPFQGDSDLDTMHRHVEEPIPRLPSPVQPFQMLLERMIAKSPADRFADAASMLEFIRRHRDALLSPGTSEDREGGPADELPDSETVLNVSAGRPGADTVTAGGQTSTLPADADTVVNETSRPGPAANLWIRLVKQRISPAAAMGGIAGLLGIVLITAVSWTPGPERTRSAALLRAEAEPRGTSPQKEKTESELEPTPGDDRPGRSQSLSQANSAPGADASRPPTADSAKQRVNELLASAEKALDDYRLTTPPDDNALRYYKAVLSLDAGNDQAEAGFDRIAARYGWLARRAIDAGFLGQAEAYINRGLEVKPGDPRLLALRDQALAGRAAREHRSADGEQGEQEIVGESPAELWNRVKGWFE